MTTGDDGRREGLSRQRAMQSVRGLVGKVRMASGELGVKWLKRGRGPVRDGK